ncbi:MAG: hypothetical protein US67_C0037G0007 [Candidatus Woesebacteria bacterium GW2011_GWD1_38_10]|uniref:Uncharacterized protein n=2 Tax=Candidatus Woeseibacteriota TaxID=1752722 RepID=A0A0G0L7H8_9BACT|nr:MAG: hypothetical protein US67_C0037G0007 [Candidatus Woesebacteria bacterium GW2011_GWD1_38_10]KKQ83800.1 MAG: hypothetical protein UT06_C0016G0021 [Candidatus Woesebacteria bacterium GW2011_GWA1_38_8]
MLTKTDLIQIKDIVQGETKKVVQAETRKIVQEENQLLENKLGKRIDRLERKMDYAINFLDRDYLKLLNRVERIEEHLNLDPIII